MSEPELPFLRNDAVRVWWFPLDDPVLGHEAAYSLLAEDEVARARRMRRQEDRERWIAARATLRQILGHHVGIEPRQLRFSYRLDGKPVLADQLGHDAPQFSLSHAGRYAVCAVSQSRRIGVDVELKGMFDHEGLARHRFASEEIALLASLPAKTRRAWFLQLWTYKEAYFKAGGAGLDAVFKDVVIMPSGAGAATIFRAQKQAEQWTLRALPMAPGYCGAVACDSRRCTIDFRGWPSAPSSCRQEG